MAEDPQSFHHERPLWRLGRVEVGGDEWGWNLAEGGDLHRIREKLGNYETMTFREIFNNDSTGCHDVDIYKMCSEAQKRVELLGLTRDSLLSLRITGEERVWGIRTDHVVELLWWDPNHQVCPSRKHGT